MEDRFILPSFLSFFLVSIWFVYESSSVAIVDVRLRRSVVKTFYAEFLRDDLIVDDSRGRIVNRPLCGRRIAIVGNDDRRLNECARTDFRTKDIWWVKMLPGTMEHCFEEE